MSSLIAVVGASGVGKTSLVQALSKAGAFTTAYEQHEERPFQKLSKENPQYALANQIDYFLVRAGQERDLRRTSSPIGLMDGGLDLDFHGFTRLFRSRGLLSGREFNLCRRVYDFLRAMLPRPELIVHLYADEATVANRLSGRERINIASAQDTALFNSFLDQWLASIPADQVLVLEVSDETLEYRKSVAAVLDRIQPLTTRGAS